MEHFRESSTSSTTNGTSLFSRDSFPSQKLTLGIPCGGIQVGCDTCLTSTDIIHAVEREHKGTGNSSVFYIGAGLTV